MASRTKIGFLATALMVGACALPAFGQANPGDNGGGNPPAGQGGGGPGGGGPGGGGGGGFQQFRQRMMDRMKTQLGMSDDEFAAIQPKLEKVMQLRRDAQGGGGFGRPGRGGPGGQAGQNNPNRPPQSAVQEKLQALQDVLNNKDSKPDDIKSKLDDYRKAKSQAKDDLVKAQDDLKSVLTERQEAVMVTMGFLE